MGGTATQPPLLGCTKGQGSPWGTLGAEFGAGQPRSLSQHKIYEFSPPLFQPLCWGMLSQTTIICHRFSCLNGAPAQGCCSLVTEPSPPLCPVQKPLLQTELVPSSMGHSPPGPHKGHTWDREGILQLEQEKARMHLGNSRPRILPQDQPARPGLHTAPAQVGTQKSPHPTGSTKTTPTIPERAWGARI